MNSGAQEMIYSIQGIISGIMVRRREKKTFKNRKYLEILIKSTINILKGHQISNSGSDNCFRSVSTHSPNIFSTFGNFLHRRIS